MTTKVTVFDCRKCSWRHRHPKTLAVPTPAHSVMIDGDPSSSSACSLVVGLGADDRVGRRLLGAVRLFLSFAAGGLAALAVGAVVGLDASDFADGRGVRAERRGAM